MRTLKEKLTKMISIFGMKVCFVGCGVLGKALLHGQKHMQVTAVVATKESAQNIKDTFGIEAFYGHSHAVEEADVIVLCVKPHQLNVLDNFNLNGKLLISTLAGVNLAKLLSYAPNSEIIRAMPNTCSLIKEGVTILCYQNVSLQNKKLAEQIFEAVGIVIEMDEKHMDAATALTACGPAFVFLMIESLADGALKLGIPRSISFMMASQMVQGAARMVQQTKLHPAVLKDQVTTPGGCTIVGLQTLEKGKLRSLIASAVCDSAHACTKLNQNEDK